MFVVVCILYVTIVLNQHLKYIEMYQHSFRLKSFLGYVCFSNFEKEKIAIKNCILAKNGNKKEIFTRN